jgi:mannose-1-phosphate guanylyltransferase
MQSRPEDNLPLVAVLMAGGIGTRLWPLSRPSRPKQCLPLLGGRSLFETTIERLEGVVPARNIFVVSNSDLTPTFRTLAPAVPEENFFCEPSPRNTAPAVAYALARLRTRIPRFVMACLPSDHYIANPGVFRDLVRAAKKLAERGFLVALGIEPTGPVTGYGYIERGEPLGAVEGYPAFRVRRFIEKPDSSRAQEMVRSGEFTWNSGMFFWRSDVLGEDYHRYLPEAGQALEAMTESFARGKDNEAVKSIWEKMPFISLDYGILEKSDRIAVLPARNLGWTDIGCWDALVELYRSRPELRSDEPARHYDADSKSVTVIRQTASRILATVGLDGVIIVETDDAILVCRSGRSQDVRKITDMIKTKNSAEKPH